MFVYAFSRMRLLSSCSVIMGSTLRCAVIKGGKNVYATILSRRELERIRDLGECRFLGFAHGDDPDA